MEKIDVVKHILRHTSHGQFVGSESNAWAPSNVALCKYWGKRDVELNLPVTSSLSVSLGKKGAFTKIKQAGKSDCYLVNGELINFETQFARRLKIFLDLFRPRGAHYLVTIDTNVPIAAGFASSACGFASLVQSLNQLYDWRLTKEALSVLARLGSGSASRSLHEGFVEWQRGERPDGMDSYGVKLESIWPELRLGMLTISREEKAISSRSAMQLTVETSKLYAAWPEQVARDLCGIKLALARKDFILLGQIAESNAQSMHALMQGAEPPIIYSLPETIVARAKVRELNLSGIPIFFTQDAGPNLQLLFLAEHEAPVLDVFPEIEVISPFMVNCGSQVILVNEHDMEIGVSEKLAAHVQGKLHRAFSVVIMRERQGQMELLLQQRSSAKYHSANLWSNTCCGHPQPGENLMIAAENRLRFEMGFSVALKELGYFYYRAKFSDVELIENEIDHVLVGFSERTDFPFNPDEVSNYSWLGLSVLQQDLADHPEKYTAWLPPLVNLLRIC